MSTKKNYTKQRGYLELTTDEGKKWMHLSMNFIFNLEEHTGEDLITWSKKLSEGTKVKQTLMICDIAYSGLMAFDQEEGNEIDYNIYKVRNWVVETMNQDSNFTKNIIDTLSNSLGKQTGVKE